VTVTSLSAHGIAAPLPRGFEGRIFVRAAVGDEVPYPVAHFATFALPANVADFGGGAVDLMGPNDVFVVLFEYGPESLGRALFARQGMPRSLGTDDFRPSVLKRGLGGQSGTQWFFTDGGRPFSLYAVLGSHARRGALVPRVNGLLRSVAISPTPTSAPTPTPAAATSISSGDRWN
jgi:hypothetical protein